MSCIKVSCNMLVVAALEPAIVDTDQIDDLPIAWPVPLVIFVS